MAIDDVITDSYLSLAGSATTAVQPASGDEWVITYIGVDNSGDIRLMGYDGSNATSGLYFHPEGGNTATHQALNLTEGSRLRLAFTNSQYFRIENNIGATEGAMYCGFKSKD